MHPIQIAVIGSGRVAQTLLRLSYDAQISIGGIYARNQQKAEALALKYNTKAVNSISALKADLILLCVSDDALPEVIGQLSPQQFAAYTAGSPSIKLFGHENLGVCYPYQSISTNRDLLVSDIPFMIEGKNDFVFQRVTAFLQQLGAQFQPCGSAQRAQYHRHNMRGHVLPPLRAGASQSAGQSNPWPKRLGPSDHPAAPDHAHRPHPQKQCWFAPIAR